MPGAPQVLVIDDEPATVRLLVEMLRGHGVRLRVALEGEDGGRKAVAHQPDAILRDICMPAPDGLCLCRRLKADPRTAEIPVLFLTGRITPRDKLAGFQAGASDYITKPYQAEEVLARLRVHQDMRRRLRALAVREPAERATGTEIPAAVEGAIRPPAHGPASSPAAAGALPEAAAGSRADRLLALAIATLRADFAEPPILPELARRIGTNERTLTELFANASGGRCSPGCARSASGAPATCCSAASRTSAASPAKWATPAPRPSRLLSASASA